MHAVVALALPAVEAFDLAIPAQVFGDPGLPERYSFTVCAPAPGLVPCTTGYALHTGHGLEALAAADTIVVPGYLPLEDPGEQVCSALRQAAARGARVVSVCTGAFALAAAGLLDHRRAATHWQYAGELAARYPAVKVDPDVLWVDEGPLLTSAGLAAGIDLCIQLVRSDYGSDAAVGVARRMVVAPHREGGQAQWIERPVPPPGEGLAATCAWAMEHLAEPLTVADLARHAGWAPRTLARRFIAETGLAPLRWVIAARVREARRLLEVTDLPVEDVAVRAGLGTAANLRLHLARDAGTTPTAYRAAYQGRIRSREGTPIQAGSLRYRADPAARRRGGPADDGVMSNITPLLDRNRAFAETDARQNVPRSRSSRGRTSTSSPASTAGSIRRRSWGSSWVSARAAQHRRPGDPGRHRDIAYASYLVKSKAPEGPWFEVAVIHHTDCGSALLADDELRHGFAQRIGVDERTLAETPVLDPARTVQTDVQRVLWAEEIPPTSGFRPRLRRRDGPRDHRRDAKAG